ncbi:MAG: hypothetical protein ABSE56_16465 [Bryobacteraceae bacterium]
MRTPLCGILALTMLVSAQPSANYRVLWEREFGDFADPFFLQGAGVDQQGDLWVLTEAFTGARDYSRKQTLFRIDASGVQRRRDDVEAQISRDLTRELAEYYPAVLPGGPAGFLVHVDRIGGRSNQSRGAFYAPLLKPGSVGMPVRISGVDGPLFWQIVPLADGDLLAVGDQSPLAVQKLSPAGEIRWQRRFWKWLTVPQAAAMEEGESCIVSSAYPRTSDPQELHLLRLDKNGALQRQARFHGHLGAVAAGPAGACAVFYYDYQPGKMLEARYHLAVFDRSFTRQWTRDIPPSVAGRTGEPWCLIALRDGYLASGTAWDGGLFLARYSWSGDLRWIETLNPSFRREFLLPSADGFYLIGEKGRPKGPPTSFAVTRAAVLR